MDRLKRIRPTDGDAVDATRWMLRLLDSDLDEVVLEEFEEWLKGGDRRLHEFDKMCAIWNAVGVCPHWVRPT